MTTLLQTRKILQWTEWLDNNLHVPSGQFCIST